MPPGFDPSASAISGIAEYQVPIFMVAGALSLGLAIYLVIKYIR